VFSFVKEHDAVATSVFECGDYRTVTIELETRPKICMVVGYLSHHDYFLNSADERVILITNQPQLFTNSRKSIILHIGYV